MLEEVEPADPVHMLACGDRDIFAEGNLTDSQLVAAVNAPTHEDPRVPTQYPEVEVALHPVPIECWASKSEQESAMYPSIEGQDKGLEDPSLSLQSVEPALGQGSSRQEFEQWSPPISA